MSITRLRARLPALGPLARNPQAWLLALAVACAALAYVLAHRYLSGQVQAVRAQAAAAYATRDVVVAAAPLPQGRRLEPADIARRAVPERFLASDALDPSGAGAVLGQRLLRALQPGEVLTHSALESQATATLASLVPAGERAYTLPVDEASSAAGLLEPGDRVDVLFVPHPEAGDEPVAPRVLPLLEAVPVLATGHATRRPSPGPSSGDPGWGGAEAALAQYATITLRVTPEQVQRLMLAQKLGELSIAVRPADDPGLPAMAPFGRDALLGHGPRPLHVAVPAVEFIVGGAGAVPGPGRRSAGGRS